MSGERLPAVRVGPFDLAPELARIEERLP